MFRTLYLKFLKLNGKVCSQYFLSNVSLLSHHSEIRCVLVGLFTTCRNYSCDEVVQLFPSLFSCVKADFGSLFKSDWETVSFLKWAAILLLSNFSFHYFGNYWTVKNVLLCSLKNPHHLFLASNAFFRKLLDDRRSRCVPSWW